MTNNLSIGTKVRTTYYYPWTGTIDKPRKREGVPSSDWYIIAGDDGSRSCVHRDMLVVRNEP